MWWMSIDQYTRRLFPLLHTLGRPKLEWSFRYGGMVRVLVKNGSWGAHSLGEEALFDD